MDQVRLEMCGATEVDAAVVMRFVQELRGIPQDALCEVEEIVCRRGIKPPSLGAKTRPQMATFSLIQNCVTLTCDKSVAEFLCQKFRERCQHVTGGELMNVQCKRTNLDSIILKTETSPIKNVPDHPGTFTMTDSTHEPQHQFQSLPMDKVIDLLDFLGDQVVDARDAYEAFAEQDAVPPQRLTLIGMTKALTQLCVLTQRYFLHLDQETWYRRSTDRHRSAASIHLSAVMNLVDPGQQCDTDGTFGKEVHRRKSRRRTDKVLANPDSDIETCSIEHRRGSRSGLSSQGLDMKDRVERKHHRNSGNERFLMKQVVSSDRPHDQNGDVTKQTAPLPTNSRAAIGGSRPHVPSTSTWDAIGGYLQDSTAVARRNLTSSSSSVRPSKQWSERTLALRSPYDFIHERTNNNDDEEESDAVEEREYLGERPETVAITTLDDWLYEDSHHAKQITNALSSRPKRSRHVSAGVNREINGDVDASREKPPSNNLLKDRPPSRQSHAFPTHLIDTNAFIASTKTKTVVVRDKCGTKRDSSTPTNVSPTTTNERPPSRYMMKTKRKSHSDLAKDSSRTASPKEAAVNNKPARLPSRRCIENVYSSHHDPKMDGFADVDESVPPPFRIEITTDSYHHTDPCSSSPTTASSVGSSSANDHAHTHKSMRFRRFSSFSNQEHLLHMIGNSGHDSDALIGSSKIAMKPTPLRWFGDDDQINDAHLFETVTSSSSLSLCQGFDAPGCRSSEKVNTIGTHPPTVPTKSPESIGVGITSTASSAGSTLYQSNDQRWFRSSNNPFFSNSMVDYDAMDPETAIAETPLYSSEDLMASAIQMSDLRLDDYTMGEQAAPMSIGVGPSVAVNSTSPLHTSLGQDFLSLFAQH